MIREKSKGGGPPEDESTDAGHRGGTARSSDEAPVMGVERRGCVVQGVFIDQPGMGGVSEYHQAIRDFKETHFSSMEEDQGKQGRFWCGLADDPGF